MSSRDANNPWGQSVTANKPSNNNPPKNGRRQPKPKTATANTANTAAAPTTRNQQQPAQSGNANADKFLAAQSKHIEAARKHCAVYESSEEEDEEAAGATDSMLASVFKGYAGDRGELHKTQQFLENMFQSGAAICLICIATVKRPDFIWSCHDCFSFFHLSCIQRWATDSTSLKRSAQHTEVDHYNNQGQLVPAKVIRIQWDCPKCRKAYEYAEIPRDYNCFCGKELNPPNHPWLVPHSCGEPCQRRLQPDCGHRCLLLCHPGPCPPCPAIVTRSCVCQQSAARTIRCAQRQWHCQRKCDQSLACGSHQCQRVCHATGECPPCERRSQQSCQCGRAREQRNCNERQWQCAEFCGRQLECGRHLCERRCHGGDECGPCPRGLPRTCPCGVESLVAPCSEEVAPCGRTCGRWLDCGQHQCAERCHAGACGQCLITVEKQCRCGAHRKELPCSKEFTCELKCREQRSCQKHACNRKCCDGQCPPCDRQCGRQLACGRHKCASLCHLGQCYPCGHRTAVRCACGQTVREGVPCGREKRVRPPRCEQPCKRQPAGGRCHHGQAHRCHGGECPACVQPCGLANETTGCEHPCEARCHEAVRVTLVDRSHRPAGPWDVAAERRVVRKEPHPPCSVRVAVTCVGGHETVQVACAEAMSRSCGRECGRQLRCGNHRCQRECHAVGSLESTKQDEACVPCTDGCANQRPDGCGHACDKPCHLGPCAKCRVNIKFDCHCGSTPVYYKCGDFFSSDVLADRREQMQSCGNRCTRNFDCGHRCLATCHSGACPNPGTCNKKVKVTCSCKTRKSETTCDQIRSGYQLECGEKCAQKVDQIRLDAEEAERRQQQLEEEKNRLELLEFEKKFGKRKPKERKQQVVEEVPGIGKWMWIGAGLVVLVALVALGFILSR